MPLPSSDYLTLQNAATATGNGTILNVADRAVVRFQVSGTYGGVIAFEATVDGTNWMALQTMSYGGIVATSTATTGTFFAPVAGYRYVRARVSSYSSGSVTVVAHATAAAAPIQPLLTANNTVDGTSGSNTFPMVQTTAYLCNGSTWDRERGNVDLSVLASAARTATTNSADQTNYNGKGVLVTLAVSAITDTPSIVLSIEAKMGSNYEALLTASAAVTATGVHSYLVYPGAGAASADIVQTASFPLPRTWRVTVTHADADSITYSVTASVIR